MKKFIIKYTDNITLIPLKHEKVEIPDDISPKDWVEKSNRILEALNKPFRVQLA